ncbi:MAG: F0F1 ATP synthase subunit B [Phycisphaerae bacterium]
MTWIWPTIVFAVVVLVLLTKAWPPIRKALEVRADGIRLALENARRERAEADALLSKYREQIDRAKREVDEIIAEGKRDAAEVLKRMSDEARREATETVDRARREIRLLTDTAVKSLYDRTQAISLAVATEIIRRELKGDDHKQIISESIRRMEAAKN